MQNSRLYTERATVAETLQRSLLPEALPAIEGWDLAALYRAAAGGMEVGGDFYDVFAVGDAWIVLIGDVTGKGVEAAALTSLVRHSARIVAEDTPDPARDPAATGPGAARPTSMSICSALCLRLDRSGRHPQHGRPPLPLVPSPTASPPSAVRGPCSVPSRRGSGETRR